MTHSSTAAAIVVNWRMICFVYTHIYIYFILCSFDDNGTFRCIEKKACAHARFDKISTNQQKKNEKKRDKNQTEDSTTTKVGWQQFIRKHSVYTNQSLIKITSNIEIIFVYFNSKGMNNENKTPRCLLSLYVCLFLSLVVARHYWIA